VTDREDAEPWRWQVLSGPAEEPLEAGTAGDEESARREAEAAMRAHDKQGPLLGLAFGPDGKADSCRRTRDGQWRWLPWP
jgi:hypothetical protein